MIEVSFGGWHVLRPEFLRTCARLAAEKSAMGGVKGRSRLSFHSGVSPSYTFVRFLDEGVFGMAWNRLVRYRRVVPNCEHLPSIGSDYTCETLACFLIWRGETQSHGDF